MSFFTQLLPSWLENEIFCFSTGYVIFTLIKLEVFYSIFTAVCIVNFFLTATAKLQHHQLLLNIENSVEVLGCDDEQDWKSLKMPLPSLMSV